MRFDEQNHFIPLISPVDAVAVAKTTAEVDLGEAQWAQFYAFFGTVTTATVVVTLEKCTDTSGTSNTAIAFPYRLSAAAGTDTMGAITAATSSGVTIGVGDDDKCLIVEVDPNAVAALGGPYARLVVTPNGSTSACEVAVWAMALPRNAQNVVLSMLD
jgi:hypothetical protein